MPNSKWIVQRHRHTRWASQLFVASLLHAYAQACSESHQSGRSLDLPVGCCSASSYVNSFSAGGSMAAQGVHRRALVHISPTRCWRIARVSWPVAQPPGLLPPPPWWFAVGHARSCHLAWHASAKRLRRRLSPGTQFPTNEAAPASLSAAWLRSSNGVVSIEYGTAATL